MIRDSSTSKLENLLTGYPDRIISMRPTMSNNFYATLISVYSPTLQEIIVDKDKFHSDLRSLLRDARAEDKVIILVDFNAKVGQDFAAWKQVHEIQGVGNCNNNRRFLL